MKWGDSNLTFFAFSHFCLDICLALLVPLLPLIRDELGLTYLQAGLLLSAFSVSAGLSQILGGWLSDRFPRPTMMLMALGGVFLTTLVIGLISAYYPMLFLLVIMGMFSGAFHPAAVAMLSGQFAAGTMGKAIGLYMVGGSIGFALGPILGGLIADGLGWHAAFIILSIPSLLSVLMALRRLGYREPAVVPGTPSRSSFTGAHPPVLKQGGDGVFKVLRPALGVFTFAILTQFIAGSAMSFIPIYFVDKHHVSPTYAAMFTGILRAGGIAGSLFGGWLSDKWDRRKSIILVLVAIGPTLFLLNMMPVNALLFPVLVAFGFLMLMRQATMQPYLMDITPPRLRATVFGIYFGLAQEGLSLLLPVTGRFIDVYGVSQVFSFIALLSVGLSLAALLLIRQRKPRLA